MTRLSFRSLAGALASAIAVFAVAAAPAPGAASPAATLAEAAARMAGVASYHADVRSTMKLGSQTIAMNGGMDVDVRHNEMNATLKVGDAGSTPMRMVLSHNRLYLSTDFFADIASSHPKGLKPWLVVDLKQLAGLDLDALTDIDPSAYAGLWTQIAKQTSLTSHREGRATVLSFRVSMPTLVDVYRHNPKLLAAVGGEKTLKLLSAVKHGSVSYEIRIDGGYIVGMAMKMLYTDPMHGPASMTMSFSLSDYGKPVTIETPDARQTMTLAQMQKLGG